MAHFSMTEGTTIEFSVFGVPNPLRVRPDSVRAYEDRYFHATEQNSLKKRANTFKWKSLLDQRENLHIFTYQTFSEHKEGYHDLEEFLRFHNLSPWLQWGGLSIPKERSTYSLGSGTTAFYTAFELDGQTRHNFCIVGRNHAVVRRFQEQYAPGQSNINFSRYLTDHVGKSYEAFRQKQGKPS
jgi:hypothetical protein